MYHAEGVFAILSSTARETADAAETRSSTDRSSRKLQEGLRARASLDQRLPVEALASLLAKTRRVNFERILELVSRRPHLAKRTDFGQGAAACVLAVEWPRNRGAPELRDSGALRKLLRREVCEVEAEP